MFDAISQLFRSKRPKYAGSKILVVEDNELDLKLIVSILEKKKFHVVHARNGEEGLEVARKESPAAIILDCEMPVLNGIEMCRILKEDPIIKDIPVLFLTGIKTPGNVIECFEADAENFLEKPVDPKVLFSEVEELLDKKLKAKG